MSKRKPKPPDPLADFIAAAEAVAKSLTWVVVGGIGTPEQEALVRAYRALLRDRVDRAIRPEASR